MSRVWCCSSSETIYKAWGDAGLYSIKVKSDETIFATILLWQREEHTAAGVLLARPAALHEEERKLDLLSRRLSRRSVAFSRSNNNVNLFSSTAPRENDSLISRLTDTMCQVNGLNRLTKTKTQIVVYVYVLCKNLLPA